MMLKIKKSDKIFEKFIDSFESLNYLFFDIDKNDKELLKEVEISKKLNEFEIQISKTLKQETKENENILRSLIYQFYLNS